ncbi:competence type IV pilus minor pilin ComGG [Streptococcus pneumoniae]
MWKKKVKAGVLLYALFMAAVFSLVLQFYLNREVASSHNFLLSQERAKAYAMARFARDEIKENSGEIAFKQGTAHYQKEKMSLSITSHLASRRRYQFLFPHAQKEEKKTEEKVQKSISKTDSKTKLQEEKEELVSENRETPSHNSTLE